MERCSTGKKVYYTKQDAEDALIEAWERNTYRLGGGPINVYQCQDCHFYHWTSQGQMNERLNHALNDGSIARAREANRWRGQL